MNSEPVPVPNIRVISREAAIERIRQELLSLTDDEHSVCLVAARRGIFCRGFARYHEATLRKIYGWLAHRNPQMDRAELEELANTWQLARQSVRDEPLACDVQSIEHDSCCGWEMFGNDELARFCKELAALEVEVSGSVQL